MTNFDNELNLQEMNGITGGTKPANKKGCLLYQVQRGDTLFRIAKTYHTTVDAILAVNPQIKNRNLIIAGQYLQIPVR